MMPVTRSSPLRVLVVDDQSFMRIALRRIIEADGDMLVVGQARNGVEAVALAQQLKPDAITMDVEMPELGGLDACAQIMREVRPPPIVIMVSAYTQSGATATAQALRLGAVDFVSKSSLHAQTDLAQIDSELRDKLRAWAQFKTARVTASAPVIEAPVLAVRRRPDLIVVAVSTGGPQTLTGLLKAMGPVEVPIAIALHMPQFFTASFAKMLAQDTGCTVCEGTNRQRLAPGTVTILPGGSDGVVGLHVEGGYELRIVSVEASVHPSADALFESAAMVVPRPVGVVLTGMGADGARGVQALRRKQAPILVQDPESCIVGGMPEAAIAAVADCEILSIERIAQRLATWSRQPGTAEPG
jgi:two-component system, chemotaxis family, protein-glutamate methylesterase/glutaminase